MLKNFNNNFLSKEIVLLFLLYLTLLTSFFLGENSTGGATNDYLRQKHISLAFSIEFFESLIKYNEFSTRHSPVLIIFLSLFERLDFSDFFLRLTHLHLCLFLPFFFYQSLKIKFKNCENKILLILTSLIFISPTFRSLAIWPDSRILGLTFFTIGIFFFLKFENEKKFKFVINNIFFVAISAYFSPNFSIFSLFFFLRFIEFYKVISKKILLVSILNLLLSLPALYYVFILDINFFLKTAAIGIDHNEKILFNNLFNDILINFSMMIFYIAPFLIFKIINLENFFNFKNIFISILIFISCVSYFDYNFLYGGGSIFFKASNFIFNNNYFFYFISFISIILLLPLITKNKFNILFFIMIILNNPQYTLYHKYFDPFLLITFFTIFSFNLNLKKILFRNNYVYVFLYFVVFLIVNNLKYLWTV